MSFSSCWETVPCSARCQACLEFYFPLDLLRVPVHECNFLLKQTVWGSLSIRIFHLADFTFCPNMDSNFRLTELQIFSISSGGIFLNFYWKCCQSWDFAFYPKSSLPLWQLHCWFLQQIYEATATIAFGWIAGAQARRLQTQFLPQPPQNHKGLTVFHE